uniref:TGF-beta family profile domain-containing protein n=1 Tax=Nothobranchius furzeri TaxID=105023 RepID=A0A8C6MDS9_NOTFU
MRTLSRSVVVKRELSQKAKLSIYRSIYVPILTYGHELWVMTERTRSRIQVAEMSFLRRVAGLSLRDRVRSSDIREGLGPFVMDEMDDHLSIRWAGRSPRSSDPSEPQPKGSQKKRKKRKKKEKEEEAGEGDRRAKGRSRFSKQSSRDCRVEKKEMKVRDLGLGFDSDEIVLFKFCVGSCQSSRTTYDLALKALLENGSLPRRTARKVSSHPCCRPDRYEPVSFMDAQTTWRTIQSLSAASCMCVG